MDSKIEYKKQLIELYMKSSKHSNYQTLPESLKVLIPNSEIKTSSKWEYERWKYICQHLSFDNKKILDIGGNTGFFTFESMTNGALFVDYYEGNNEHAEFVRLASQLLQLEQQINVFPEYYLFKEGNKIYDIALCLNVIHHLGDDFQSENNIKEAKEKMIICINNLSTITDILVFQMGFNWCGNRDQCLFPNGTKIEMKEFIEKGIEDFWEIIHTGVAVCSQNEIEYVDMNTENHVRMNQLGEFLNRPLFIMKSKHKPN